MATGIIILILTGLYLMMWRENLKMWNRRTQDAWNLLQERYKHRSDLIPGVRAVLKKNGKTMQEALQHLTRCVQKTQGPLSVGERLRAERVLSQSLDDVLTQAMQNPNVAGTHNVLEMQMEIADTQELIQSAELFYDTVARAYNARLSYPPGHWAARRLSLLPAQTDEQMFQRPVLKKKT